MARKWSVVAKFEGPMRAAAAAANALVQTGFVEVDDIELSDMGNEVHVLTSGQSPADKGFTRGFIYGHARGSLHPVSF